MGFTLVAWSASIQGTDLELTPVPDQHVRFEGNNLVVPESYNKVLGVYVIGSNVTGATLSAPSLRALALINVHPFERNATPRFPARFADYTSAPIELSPGEQLVTLASTDGTGATQATALVWLGDRMPAPVTGRIVTVRATGSATLTAYSWSPVTLTFTQRLPVGRYAVVGFAARSAGIIAARIVFVGGVWRPGVIGHPAVGDPSHMIFRFGNFGAFGEFHTTTPPSLEVLSSSADTTQEFYFDLVKVA